MFAVTQLAAEPARDAILTMEQLVPAIMFHPGVIRMEIVLPVLGLVMEAAREQGQVTPVMAAALVLRSQNIVVMAQLAQVVVVAAAIFAIILVFVDWMVLFMTVSSVTVRAAAQLTMKMVAVRANTVLQVIIVILITRVKLFRVQAHVGEEMKMITATLETRLLMAVRFTI